MAPRGLRAHVSPPPLPGRAPGASAAHARAPAPSPPPPPRVPRAAGPARRLGGWRTALSAVPGADRMFPRPHPRRPPSFLESPSRLSGAAPATPAAVWRRARPGGALAAGPPRGGGGWGGWVRGQGAAGCTVCDPGSWRRPGSGSATLPTPPSRPQLAARPRPGGGPRAAPRHDPWGEPVAQTPPPGAGDPRATPSPRPGGADVEGPLAPVGPPAAAALPAAGAEPRLAALGWPRPVAWRPPSSRTPLFRTAGTDLTAPAALALHSDPF